ncbi:MAG: hypothetical protein SFU53_11295 [Terrimicrobiaceae bacterium]|nr:hypothetical protein [Terrimicrobiaceae bacterium]
MNRHIFAFVAALMAGLAGVSAEVVRPSPEFRWVDASGATKSSKDFRGRAVIVLIANSPRQWAFRSQVGQLQRMYERIAAERVVCVAAFSREPGVVRSNIPFVTVPDGPRVAFDFNAPDGFTIAIIGRDGNLDFISNRVTPVQRIYDILDNSFVVQRALRRP